MTIREAWEKKKAAQASAQAFARSGETVAPNGRQSAGGIKVHLAAIVDALAAFGKKAAEKLRQKHKDNDGRSQTAKSVPVLAGGSGGRLGLAPQPATPKRKIRRLSKFFRRKVLAFILGIRILRFCHEK